MIMNTRSGDTVRTSDMIHGARSGHGCTGLTGDQGTVTRVIIVGGDSWPGDVSRSVEQYHVASDRWEELTPLPWSVTGAPGVLSYGDMILVVGGYSGHDTSGVSSSLLKWSYDTNWTLLKTEMRYPRAMYPLIKLS